MRHSLSKWGTFNQCPAKYKYAYLERRPGDTSLAMQRGTDIHKSFEDAIKHDTPLPPPFDRYNSFLENLKRGATVISEGKILVDKDWKYTENDDDAWVIAILDMSVLTPDTLGVYDWKTGKVYDDHKNQKELYSLLGHAKHPEVKRIEAHHVYVDLGKNTKITYDISDLDGVRQRWTANFKALEYTTEFIPTPSFKCRFCAHSRSKGGPCPF